MSFGSAVYTRRPIGLASGDLELRKLLSSFTSTPETERFGRLAAGRSFSRGATPTATPRALSRESEQQVPVSLAEQAVARLQDDGKQAFKAQDLPRAIEAWSDAIVQVRSIPAPTPKKLESTRAAQLLANRCQAYLKLGKETEALADAEAACDAAPGWPKAYYRLGTVLMERGQLKRAHAVLSQGLQLDMANDEMRRVLYKVKELRQEQEDAPEAAAPEAAAATPEAAQMQASAAHEDGTAEYGPSPKSTNDDPVEYGPPTKPPSNR